MRSNVCTREGLKILSKVGVIGSHSLGVTGPDAVLLTHDLLISIDGINP